MDYLHFTLDWLEARGLTPPDEIIEAVKRKRRIVVNGDVPARTRREKEMQAKLESLFANQFDLVMEKLGDPPNIANIPFDFWESQGIVMSKEMAPLILNTYLAQAAHVLAQQPIAIDWGLVNQAAVNFAQSYSFDLVTKINKTTAQALGQAVGQFFGEGLTRQQLEDLLIGQFGPVRSEMISVTEITRAAAQAQEATRVELAKAGINMTEIWQTENDELVCPICGPLHNKDKGDGWDEPPPAHPRCRCWTNLEYRP